MRAGPSGADGKARPAKARARGTLDEAVTFFTTRAQKRALLRALRAVDRDRTRALLVVAGVVGEVGAEVRGVSAEG